MASSGAFFSNRTRVVKKERSESTAGKSGNGQQDPSIVREVNTNWHSLQVETDRGGDVLIRRQSLGDHVRVVDDVAAEYQAPSHREDEIHGTAEGDDDPDKACHHCE